MGANNIQYKSMDEVLEYKNDNYLVIDHQKYGTPLKIKVGNFANQLLQNVNSYIDPSSFLGLPTQDGQHLTGDTDGTYNWVTPDYLSPGDNVSELSNDVGYITLADVPTPATPTWDAVVEAGSDVDTFLDNKFLSFNSINGLRHIRWAKTDETLLRKFIHGFADGVNISINASSIVQTLDLTSTRRKYSTEILSGDDFDNVSIISSKHEYFNGDVFLKSTLGYKLITPDRLEAIVFDSESNNQIITESTTSGVGYGGNYRVNGIATHGENWINDTKYLYDMAGSRVVYHQFAGATDYTINIGYSYIFDFDSTTGNTLYLPNQTNSHEGATIFIKAIGLGAATFSVSGSGNLWIDGTTSTTHPVANGYYILKYDKTTLTWYKVN